MILDQCDRISQSLIAHVETTCILTIYNNANNYWTFILQIFAVLPAFFFHASSTALHQLLQIFLPFPNFFFLVVLGPSGDSFSDT